MGGACLGSEEGAAQRSAITEGFRHRGRCTLVRGGGGSYNFLNSDGETFLCGMPVDPFRLYM